MKCFIASVVPKPYFESIGIDIGEVFLVIKERCMQIE